METSLKEVKTPQIHSTFHYHIFKKIVGNRELNESNVRNIIDSIDNGVDYMAYNPILVTEDLHIIDGQHRLEVCQRLKRPVYYVKVPTIDIYHIAMLNNNSKKWSLIDYINCYADIGKKDYVFLKEYIQKTPISASIAIQLLQYGHANGMRNATGAMKEGRFKVNFLEKTDNVSTLVKMWKDYSFHYRPDFVKACIKVYEVAGFDLNVMHSKLQFENNKGFPCDNVKDYIRMIEGVYNYRNSKNIVRFL